ncbi:MAG: serine/threonine protein kinase [Gemmatimonadetes bacterium]|nr:serine/threonine protein kinase [Gemmatimonadota bacterium]
MTDSPEFRALQAALRGRYVLERELGRGGMGAVYLAREVALDRLVALKLLLPHLAGTPELRERFLREARTAARLAHPHIVPIHAVESTGTLVWFAMGYVAGETLAERVRAQGPLAAPQVERLVREVAWALAYAHQQGVVHRDVKPENILLERLTGRALVADFGIAHLTEATPVTPAGDLVGTARAVSPEQAAGEPVDGRSDLYSLGVTAYFALTGRYPFEADGAAGLLMQHLMVPAPPVASVRAHVPRALATAIDRCLAKAPGDRFATGEALSAALEAGGSALPAVPPTLEALARETRQLGVDLTGYATLAATAIVAQLLTAAHDFFGFGQIYTSGLTILLGTLTALKGISVAAHARRALREGWTADDLAEAVRAGAAAEAAAEPPPMPLRKASVLFGLGLAAVLGFWMGPRDILLGVLEGWPAQLVLELISFGLPIALGRWFGTRLDAPEGGKPGLMSRFAVWKGRKLLQLAGLGRRTPAPPALPAAAPTEVLLAGQAEGLFAALPPAQQERLADVGRTLRQLSTEATALRARDEELAQAEAAAGGPGDPARDQVRAEFAAERRRVAVKLAERLAALDTLRLDLLRLRAGTATPEGLTGALEVVRRVSRDVDAALEVDELPGR